MRFASLTAALLACSRDDRHLILIDGEDRQQRLSFAELKTRAERLLGTLQRRGLRSGDAVILFVNDNQRFLEMFWACVLGGLVPVPIATGSADEHRRKLFRVFAQFERAWIYSDARMLERIDAFAVAQGYAEIYAQLQTRTLLSDALEWDGAVGTLSTPAEDDIAFIQYSSGSTSEPKGVVLSHRNLCANIESIIAAAQFSDRDVALSWMPLTHDMGLIGFHLNMLVAGATHAIMRTDLFARRPLLWLSKASELRASVLCSPNFGYEHYLKQYAARQPQGLDLSAVRLIFNGAEPISAELCERFTQTLAPQGLVPNSMFAVYGLAEASLAVSFPQPGAPLTTLTLDRGRFAVGEPVVRVPAEHPQAARLVCLGSAVPGTELRISDEAGQTQPEAHLGHVLIRGDNVTRGYFRDEAASARAISADGWLDTGDLGFIADGQLVIAGRAKDIIFIGGQNYYPHDLEAIATSVPGVETNKLVAAGARHGGVGAEVLVLFALHRGSIEEFAPTARALRAVINQQTGLEVAQLVPVSRIPKTTSGKLQRHLLVRAFEQGEFNAVTAMLDSLLEAADERSGNSRANELAVGTLARLQAVCDQVIPEKRVASTTHLLEINLNSLTLARLHEAIDQEFPGRLEVADLFEYPTLEALAHFLDAQAVKA